MKFGKITRLQVCLQTVSGCDSAKFSDAYKLFNSTNDDNHNKDSFLLFCLFSFLHTSWKGACMTWKRHDDWKKLISNDQKSF